MNQEACPALAARQSRTRSSGQRAARRAQGLVGGPVLAAALAQVDPRDPAHALAAQLPHHAVDGTGQRAVVVAELEDDGGAEPAPVGLDGGQPARRPGGLTGRDAAVDGATAGDRVERRRRPAPAASVSTSADHAATESPSR